mgnify:CR=1 FL=1
MLTKRGDETPPRIPISLMKNQNVSYNSEKDYAHYLCACFVVWQRGIFQRLSSDNPWWQGKGNLDTRVSPIQGQSKQCMMSGVEHAPAFEVRALQPNGKCWGAVATVTRVRRGSESRQVWIVRAATRASGREFPKRELSLIKNFQCVSPQVNHNRRRDAFWQSKVVETSGDACLPYRKRWQSPLIY